MLFFYFIKECYFIDLIKPFRFLLGSYITGRYYENIKIFDKQEKKSNQRKSLLKSKAVQIKLLNFRKN